MRDAHRSLPPSSRAELFIRDSLGLVEEKLGESRTLRGVFNTFSDDQLSLARTIMRRSLRETARFYGYYRLDEIDPAVVPYGYQLAHIELTEHIERALRVIDSSHPKMRDRWRLLLAAASPEMNPRPPEF